MWNLTKILNFYGICNMQMFPGEDIILYWPALVGPPLNSLLVRHAPSDRYHQHRGVGVEE